MNIDIKKLTSDLNEIIDGITNVDVERADEHLMWATSPRAASDAEIAAIEAVWRRHLHSDDSNEGAIFGLRLPGGPDNPHPDRYPNVIEWGAGDEEPWLQCNGDWTVPPPSFPDDLAGWVAENIRSPYLIEFAVVSFADEADANSFAKAV